MRAYALLASAGGLLALSASPSFAGPCSAQIAELERTALSAPGAGTASPTGGTMSGAVAGSQTLPPSVSSTKSIISGPGSTADGKSAEPAPTASAATAPTASPGGTGPQAGMAPSVSSTKAMTSGPSDTAGSGVMAGAVTGAIATSPQDVRAQQQGQPTAAQQGASSVQQASDNMTMARGRLEQARALDAQNSTDCMTPLREAQQMMNTR